jgi:hypothetical protein
VAKAWETATPSRSKSTPIRNSLLAVENRLTIYSGVSANFVDYTTQVLPASNWYDGSRIAS